MYSGCGQAIQRLLDIAGPELRFVALSAERRARDQARHRTVTKRIEATID
jgi:hypothetical protein